MKLAPKKFKLKIAVFNRSFDVHICSVDKINALINSEMCDDNGGALFYENEVLWLNSDLEFRDHYELAGILSHECVHLGVEVLRGATGVGVDNLASEEWVAYCTGYAVEEISKKLELYE